MSLSKDTFTPQKVLVIPRKRWLCSDMTEKLFTGMLSLNKTKPKVLPADSVTVSLISVDNPNGQ